MSSMLESLMGQLESRGLGTLGDAVGTDETKTENALAAALPLLLAGLARNAKREEGAAALDRALAEDHDGSLLDNVTGFLGRADTSPGDGILRHVFGDRRPAVETAIASSSGVDRSQAAKLLAMAAPLIMAQLGKQRREKQLDTAALQRTLAEETRSVREQAPQLGGLARLLDADADGSIGDDVAGMLGKLLRR